MSSDQHKKSGRKGGLERKIDALSASVDQRFDEVAKRFVEQRQYTEFAFDRLTVEMRSGFSELRGDFNDLRGGFNELRGGFNELRGGFNELRGGSNELRGGFNRIERKLDQFIDMQSKTNELVERRLAALEAPRQS